MLTFVLGRLTMTNNELIRDCEKKLEELKKNLKKLKEKKTYKTKKYVGEGAHIAVGSYSKSLPIVIQTY